MAKHHIKKVRDEVERQQGILEPQENICCIRGVQPKERPSPKGYILQPRECARLPAPPPVWGVDFSSGSLEPRRHSRMWAVFNRQNKICFPFGIGTKYKSPYGSFSSGLATICSDCRQLPSLTSTNKFAFCDLTERTQPLREKCFLLFIKM